MGEEATGQILAGNPSNPAPEAGVTYALMTVKVSNTGSQVVAVDGDDFALVGSSGRIWRGTGLTAPNPLQGRLGPGEQAEGSVACRIGASDTNVICVFDNRLLTGNWTDRAIAMEPGATFASVTAPTVPPNDLGVDPGQPAAIGARSRLGTGR